MSPTLSFITGAQLYTTKLLTVPLWKTFVGLIITLLITNQISLLLLGIFILIDCITGVWKNVKVNKERFTSTKFSYTIEKSGLYAIFLAVGIGLDMHFGTTLISSIFISSMLVRESWSIVENCDCISGNNWFSSVMEKAKTLFKK